MDRNNLFISDSKYSFIPLSSEQLVDRQAQVNKFADVLDRIVRQMPLNQNLFEWYGCPGIGKSILVTMLARRADEKHAAWTVVNFKQLGEKTVATYLRDPIILVEEIISDLKKQIILDEQEFKVALQVYRNIALPVDGVVPAYLALDLEARLYRRPAWLTELRNVVIAFIKLVNTLPFQVRVDARPVVLFFDETEYADIELVDWIEEWIINPLIQIKHCVVVWTARRPWRWKRLEIRRRLTSEMLEVFEPDVVKEQILVQSATPNLVVELFKNVYSLTGGHPFASYIVVTELDVLAKQGNEISFETFPGFESKLLTEIMNIFINQYAFRELDSHDLKITCKFIALVRLFDSSMLRKILQTCAGDLFMPWNQDDFSDLLLKLKKTQLLVWEKGYAIDPSLRHIIQKYFMVLDRKMFITANRAALAMYEDWLGRPVDNRGLFLLEELYHNALLAFIGEKIDLRKVLMRRLEEYPNWFKDKNALSNALERLEGEINNDKELADFVPFVDELVNIVHLEIERIHSDNVRL